MLSKDAKAGKCLEKSQYEMPGCHVDLEQVGPPDDDDDDETQGIKCDNNVNNGTDVSE